MSVDDQSDVWRELRAMKKEIKRLQSSSMLENSSITRGRMRFIGGTLRVDSGGRVEIVGFLQVEGQTNIIGPVTIAGTLNITGNTSVTGTFTTTGQVNLNGPTDINGTTEINGDTSITGALDLTGQMLVRSAGGRITIESDQTGRPPIVIEDGAFTIGISQIFGDESGLRLNAAEGGVTSGLTLAPDLIQLARFASTSGILQAILMTSSGIRMQGIEDAPSTEGKKLVAIDDNDKLWLVPFGTGGGPGDGIFAWPFPTSQVTSEFRTPSRPTHDGIDFGIGPSNTEGTPIPAAGAGVVYDILSVNDGTHGWGNGVILDHGTDPLYDGGGHNIKTLYAHMSTAPVVAQGSAVALGQTLGPIGNTGNSFGNHLHWEVWVDDVPVNPRTFMAAHNG